MRRNTQLDREPEGGIRGGEVGEVQTRDAVVVVVEYGRGGGSGGRWSKIVWWNGGDVECPQHGGTAATREQAQLGMQEDEYVYRALAPMAVGISTGSTEQWALEGLHDRPRSVGSGRGGQA